MNMSEVYIGDLSIQDAEVLIESVSGAGRVLDFGVGASTQLIPPLPN